MMDRAAGAPEIARAQTLSGTSLMLSHAALHKIKLHAMRTYPEECCGVLFGDADGSSKKVCDVLEIRNAKEENRGRRFLITAAEYRWAEERAAKKGVSLLGFYHSHPDHPAEPSQFDLDHAMPWCSYLIAAVRDGNPAAVRSWILREDRSAFDEEILEITDGELLRPCGEGRGDDHH